MIDLQTIVDDFIVKTYGDAFTDYQLSSISYWKIGGFCKAVFYPNSISGLQYLVEVLRNNNIRHNIVGKTSNLLFTSEEIQGALIILGRDFDYVVEDDSGQFIIGAAASVPWTCYKLGSKGFTGLEHCVGIPGTLGGLIYMNGGSMRQAVGDRVVWVKAMKRSDGKVIKLTDNECQFSYRKSIFQNNDYIILEVKVQLDKSSPKAIKANMLDVLRQRRAKFPLDYPSCGSVFKSTPQIYEQYGPPGKIIENLGFKNKKQGGARVSNKHANFIINEASASSSDIIELVRAISNSFYEQTGLWLPTEVNLVNNKLEIIPLSDVLSEC